MTVPGARTDHGQVLRDVHLLRKGAGSDLHGVAGAGDVDRVLHGLAGLGVVVAVVERVVTAGGHEPGRGLALSAGIAHVVEEETIARVALGGAGDTEEQRIHWGRCAERRVLVVPEVVFPGRPGERSAPIDAHAYDVVRLAIVEFHREVELVARRAGEVRREYGEDEAFPLSVDPVHGSIQAVREGVRRRPVVVEAHGETGAAVRGTHTHA
jgi:hypothetical protein